eukprot:NODE_374_length_9848_cov_0.468971.p9 type:complete len:104 gc:universal NODE_374_length_9848_cov_0.468971:651-962(+)
MSVLRPIISLAPSNNISCKVIIVEKISNATFLVADNTGSIHADVAYKYCNYLKVGDIVELRGYNCKQMIQQSLKLRFDDLSLIYKVGEYVMLFKAFPNRTVIQ